MDIANGFFASYTTTTTKVAAVYRHIDEVATLSLFIINSGRPGHLAGRTQAHAHSNLAHSLTDDGQIDDQRQRRMHGHLALVVAGVSGVGILNNELPVIRLPVFEVEARVADVRLMSERYEVQLVGAAPTHPGHLCVCVGVYNRVCADESEVDG